MHQHYDVPAIERQIRAMYKQASTSDFSDDPATGESVRRSVDVAAAASNFMFSEMNNGVPPHVLIQALETIVVNIIVNSLQSFRSDQEKGCMLCQFLEGIHKDAHTAWHQREDGVISNNGFEVSPVMSGNA